MTPLSAANSCAGSLHTCHLPDLWEFPWLKKQSGCFVDKSVTIANYDKLPSEILRHVFGFLEPEDLKTVLLVSRTWKSVAEEPSLWTGFGLPETCKNSVQNLLEFSKMSLFFNLQHLDLSDFTFKFSDEHFKLFLSLDLSSIEFSGMNLSGVSDGLLGKIVNSCKECVIKECFTVINANGSYKTLGLEKISNILSEVQEDTKLRSFKLSHDLDSRKLDVTDIPPDILSRAFSKLTMLKLENLHLSSEQMTSIFDGFVNLKSLVFNGILLDATQTSHLVEALDKAWRLKSLNLSDVDVTDIPSMVLSNTMLKIVKVELKNVLMETSQIEDIFLAFTTGDYDMKHLSMVGMNDEDELSVVNAEVFARAVNKLESFYFDGDLPEDQLKEMFKVMSVGTSLKMIGCPGEQIPVDQLQYISEIDPEVLSKALNNLQSVRFGFGNEKDIGCFLRVPQLMAFFKQLSVKRTNLKTILMHDFEHDDVIVTHL